MPISDLEEDYLERILMACADSTLDEWSTNFISSIREAFETYGRDMRLSMKQWAVLHRIADKLGVDDAKKH